MPKLPKLCRNPVQCAVVAQAAGRLGAAVSCVHTHRQQLSYLQTVQLSDTKSSVLLLLGEEGNMRF